jgi:hypothetical protein
MESCRKTAMFLLLTAVAVCLASGFASAQVVSSGSFSLSNDAQWGKQVLTKGKYNFTVREAGMMGAMVTMTSADHSSEELHLIGMRRSADASLKGSASTVIVTRSGDGYTLRGIYLAGAGVEFEFPSHAKHKTSMAENSKTAREVTMRIPVHRNAR